jgi:hypothetical protein
MEKREETPRRSQPRFIHFTQEWTMRTGPNTWRVWKHGTDRGDAERLRAEMEKELAREHGALDKS